MTETTDRAETTATPGASATDANGSAFARVLAAGRETRTEAGFFRRALQGVAEAFAAPYAQVYVRLSSEVVHEEFHQGSTDPRFWKRTLEEFLTDALTQGRARARLFGARHSAARIALIAAPLFDRAGSEIGAVAIVTPFHGEDCWQRVAYLEAVAALMSHVAALSGQSPVRNDAHRDPAPNAALARAATIQTVEELAFSLTNGLRVKLGCDQVVLALVARKNIRILSISGHDEVAHASPGVARIRAAMEECLDAAAPIAFSANGGWVGDGASADYRLHQRWHEASHGANVASIPLRAGNGWGAVLGLRRAEKPFLSDEISAVRTAVEPYAPALHQARRANRSVGRHAIETASESVRDLLGPGRRAKKIMVLFALLSALWFFAGTVRYQITAPCELRPAEGRSIVASVAGVLASSHVVAGDVVRAGDVLFEFDTRELRLEEERLLAELDVAHAEQDAAIAANNPVDARMLAARVQLARTRLDIVQARIERSTIRSPIDGVVTLGDLRSHVGSVVSLGTPLVQIAPSGRWVLEIAVPSASAGDLAPQMSGRFASLARPEAAYPFVVNRVRPTAEVRNGANVLIVEAELGIGAEWARPGTEGTARIAVGPRLVWWVSLHRLTDSLWMNFWL